MKFYQKCLDNIELAKKHAYPMKSIDKLNKRYDSCIKMIESDLNISPNMILGSEYLKMNLTPNKKIPNIADCLRLKQDDQFGRYVITTVNLKPGEIVAIEEPFTKCLIPDPKVPYQFCANCLKDNSMDLIPCSNCTSAMFCSEKCLTEGTRKFHQFECDVIDKSNEISTKIMKIANYTFFEALDMYGNVNDFMAAVEENAGSSSTVFDFDFTDGKIMKKNLFIAIDSLASNQQYRVQADLFQRAGIVAIMTHIYLNYTKLKDVLDSDNAKNFYRRFVFKQTQIAAINYHGIYDSAADEQTSDKYGSGSYAFCSLINHSCAPNLVRVSHQCKNYVLVNRPIYAGQQLFDNYGYHHCLETLRQRQMGLKSQYMFTCSCEACTENYPLFSNLISVTNDFDYKFHEDLKKLTEFDHKTALTRVKVYCEHLQELDDQYPCREVSSLQEFLLRCFFLFKLTAFKGHILISNWRK
jgi:SET and MYND domain-containing protein 4